MFCSGPLTYQINRVHVLGVRLAVAHSLLVIGNVGGLLGGIGNIIDNIMVVREFIIFCAIKHHSGSPITIGNLIW